MATCNKCSAHGLEFDRAYEPVQFIEGRLNSQVWIVGLNPKDDGQGRDARSVADLDSYFGINQPKHSYFNDFHTVSKALFDGLGKDGGTAHTDIVKCASRSFPAGKARAAAVANCRPYLECQITRHKPRVLVCNGSAVSHFMLEFMPPPVGTPEGVTSYWTTFEGQRVCIILSGFIGRIDNYAKRRLGAEIEARIREIDAQT